MGLPLPGPFCEDLVVSAGPIPILGDFLPLLPPSKAVKRTEVEEDRHKGSGEATFSPLCFQLVRKVPVTLLSSPTEDAWKLPAGQATLAPGYLAPEKSWEPPADPLQSPPPPLLTSH